MACNGRNPLRDQNFSTGFVACTRSFEVFSEAQLDLHLLPSLSLSSILAKLLTFSTEITRLLDCTGVSCALKKLAIDILKKYEHLKLVECFIFSFSLARMLLTAALLMKRSQKFQLGKVSTVGRRSLTEAIHSYFTVNTGSSMFVSLSSFCWSVLCLN